MFYFDSQNEKKKEKRITLKEEDTIAHRKIKKEKN